MKRNNFVIVVVVCVFLLGSILAAVPQTLNLHGRLTNSSGDALTGTYNITFKIYDVVTGGSELWVSANNSITTDANGIYNFILDEVNLTFDTEYYLGVKVADDAEMIPRINLTSTPYTFKAQNISAGGIINDSNVNLVGKNITASSGLFDWLGSLVSRITTLFVQNIDFTGNINGSGNITTTGNVGIGTSSPGSKLTVWEGDFNVSNSARGQMFYVQNSSGNVGIGTASPSHKLNVIGTGNFTTGVTIPNDQTYKFGGGDFIKYWSVNQSVAVGKNAGANTLSSSYFGDSAGGANTGSSVTATGSYAGYANTGNSLTATGYNAAQSNSGGDVTATGLYAGYSNSGDYLTATGYYAALSNNAQYVTATGYQAGYENTGSALTATGYQAGRSNTGSDVTVAGYQAAHSNAGNSLTAMGYLAGYLNKGNFSSGFGYEALRSNTGNSVVAIGYQAGYSNTGDSVTTTGYYAGRSNIGGSLTAVGYYAGESNSGASVTAIGTTAGLSNSGADLTAIGLEAGRSNSGGYLTATGKTAGYSNSGDYVTATGYTAGSSNTGYYVTATGAHAGDSNTGGYLTATGYSAGRSNSGEYSSGFGYEALRSNTKDNVVGIGYQAGKDNAVRDQFIVKQANVNAVPLIQGNFSSGFVGIGTTSPSQKLHINGSGGTEIKVENTDSNNWALFGMGTDNNVRAAYLLTYGSNHSTAANHTALKNLWGDILFFTGTGGAGNTEKMRITSDGNVGIGTTAPAHKLHLNGTGNVGIRMNSGDIRSDLFSTGSLIGFNAYNDSSSEYEQINLQFETFHLRVGTAGATESIFAKSDGKVGIGTTSPTHTLNVVGNVNITGNLTVGGLGAGVPANSIMSFYQATCPTGWILADGTSGTPDLRGIFVRGAGTNGVLSMANGTAFSATYGAYQTDSFQGHWHDIRTDWSYTSGSYVASASGTGGDYTGSGMGRTIVTDTVHGTPRTGAETRPASFGLIYCMKTSEDSQTSNTIWGESGNDIVPNNSSKNVHLYENLTVDGQVSITGASRMRVTKATAQSIPNAAYTIVQYDTVVFDNLGEYNASYQFVATEAGYYLVTAAVLSTSVEWTANEAFLITIYKNGAVYSWSNYDTAGATVTRRRNPSITDIIYLAAGEYIDIRARQDIGIDMALAENALSNFFSVHRLS